MILEKKLFKFFLKILIFLLLSLILTVITLKSLYSSYDYFDFQKLKNKNLISTRALSRSSAQDIKMAYIEGRNKFEIGIFGNHIIQYHSKDVLDEKKDFFNFWYANISLTEVHHFLIYLDKINKLPDQILVGITAANNDNGASIIRYQGELPLKYISWNKIYKDFFQNRTEFFSFIYQYFSFSTLFKNIDYMNLYQILNQTFSNKTIHNSDIEDRLISYEYCKKNQRKLERDCALALKYDGSLASEFTYNRRLVKNGDTLKREVGLKPSDRYVLAYQINEINKFLKRKGKKITFYIPPVYEDNRKTIAREIFDLSLNNLDLTSVDLIDHRFLRNRKDFFVHFDHSNEKYFKFLMREVDKNNK